MTRSGITDKPRGKRLGTVTEARDALGLLDASDVWELVFIGLLDAVRDDPEHPTLWTVYDASRETDEP